MKTLKITTLLLAAVFVMGSYTYAQNNTNTKTTTKSVRKIYPHMTITPFGGAIFPLPKVLNQNFKPGGNIGLYLGYRVNKEVGLVGEFSYFFMSSKITGAPIGSYLEFTAGPRYYFVHPKLNSALFFEGGVGAYNFRQNSYINPGDTTGSSIAQINNTKAGINGGIGASLALSEAMDIMVRSKYHIVFTPNGTSSFVTVGAGLEFRFR